MTQALTDAWQQDFLLMLRKNCCHNINHNDALRDARHLVTDCLSNLNRHKKKIFTLMAYESLLRNGSDEYSALQKLDQRCMQNVIDVQLSTELTIAESLLGLEVNSELEQFLRQTKSHLRNFTLIKLILQIRHHPLVKDEPDTIILNRLNQIIDLVLQCQASDVLKNILRKESGKVSESVSFCDELKQAMEGLSLAAE